MHVPLWKRASAEWIKQCERKGGREGVNGGRQTDRKGVREAGRQANKQTGNYT